MENLNIPTPQPMQPPVEVKKWYQHKGIISAIILALIATVVIFLYFHQTSIQNNKLLNSTSQTSPVSLAQCKKDSTDKQGECFRQYGAATKDINACKAIAVYPNDVACAIGVAVALNNVKICDQVSGFLSYEAPQYGVQGCYDGYAAENKDVQICASLSGSNTFQTQFEKDTCYSGIATTLLDPSYCSYLSNAHSQDECYETIGEQKLDITICDKIIEGDVANNELKGDCYLKIAVATKNSSICDKITFFSNSQLACYQLLNVTPPQTTNSTSTTSVISTSSQLSQSQIIKNYGFSVQYPTGWYAQTNPEAGNSGFYICGPKFECNDNYLGVTITDKSYAELYIDPTQYTVKQQPSESYNGINWQVYHVAAKDSTTIDYTSYIAEASVNGTYYVVGLFTNNSIDPASLTAWQQVISGFNFSKQNIISNNSDDSVDFILDSSEATGTPNQSIQFTGKIVNNTGQIVYLNGLSGNLSYSELTFDSSPFFKLPATLKPGESASGVIFAVATSQIALPGDYTGSVQVQGGADGNASTILGDQTFVIHVTK